MAEKMPQDFSHHSRLDPPFHFLMAPVFGITWIGVIVHLVRRPALQSAWCVVFMVAATAAVIKMRLHALKVQERITRLEERLPLVSLRMNLCEVAGENSRYHS